MRVGSDQSARTAVRLVVGATATLGRVLTNTRKGTSALAISGDQAIATQAAQIAGDRVALDDGFGQLLLRVGVGLRLTHFEPDRLELARDLLGFLVVELVLEHDEAQAEPLRLGNRCRQPVLVERAVEFDADHALRLRGAYRLDRFRFRTDGVGDLSGISAFAID